MKSKPKVVVLWAALALVLTATIQAQTVNPPYLNEFPSVERVNAEIKGTDALDTAARQMSAFYELMWFIKILAGIRYDRFSSDGGPKVTADEKSVYATYGAEWNRFYNSPLSPKDKETLMNLHGSYKDLREELLRRFFSPDFRASYYRANGQEPPQTTKSQPGRAGSIDGLNPDILKARAAKVDTSVFGMEMGATFQLSKCPLIGIDLITNNCSVEGVNLESLFGLAQRKSDIDPELVRIRLAPDFRPDWLAAPDLSVGNDAWVRVHDGQLVGVYVLTKGRNVEKSVNAELRAKYGPPSSVKLGTITPDTGNAFKVSNPDWNLPGIHVEYQVIQVLPDEDRVNLNNGVVRVETESLYTRRMTKGNEPVKRKM